MPVSQATLLSETPESVADVRHERHKTSALDGGCDGLFLYRNQGWPQIIAAVAVNQFVLSLFLNTLWISILYSSPYVPLLATRVVQCLVLTAVQLVCIRAIAAVLPKYWRRSRT